MRLHNCSDKLDTGVLLVITAAVLFSSKSIFIKLAYEYGVDAVTLLCLRMLFALPFFILVACIQQYKKNSVTMRYNNIITVIILGLLGYYLSSLLDFIGLQYISASLERLILFLYPTMTLIIAAVFMRHKVTKKEIICLILSYSGVLLVFMHDLSSQQNNNILLGSWLVFCSALAYAVYLIGAHKQIDKLGDKRFTALAMTVSCIAVIIHFLITRQIDDLQQESTVYVYAVIIAIFATVLPAFLMNAGIKKLGPANASMIGSIGPIATIIFGAIFIGEDITFMRICGAILVIIGVISLKAKKTSKKTNIKAIRFYLD